ncbi:MAG TPA: CBS domain-containing protein [Saprospiraceae bacterium]|nr:CBS domain-containing protein [Saprospiraceae bacterium]
MFAKQLISTELTPLKTSDTGTEALAQMNDAHVEHLPIVNHKQLLGVISEEDILGFHLDEVIGSYQLSLRKAFVLESDHLFEVMRVMGAEELTLIPVVDELNNYIGSIRMQDVLHSFSKMASFVEPGGVIVLEMQRHEYSMHEIARIVEGENAKILSFFVGTRPDSQLVDVMLKLDRNHELGGILSTFNRFGYHIKASFINDEYLDSLQDNFNSLMNYLNM